MAGTLAAVLDALTDREAKELTAAIRAEVAEMVPRGVALQGPAWRCKAPTL